MIRTWIRAYAAYSIIFITSIPVFILAFAPAQSDMWVYFTAVMKIKEGGEIYKDIIFEYPPYVLFLFIIPAVAKHIIGFKVLFALQILAFDMALKFLLLHYGKKYSKGWQSLYPLITYCAGFLFVSSFYVQRYDIASAFVTTVAILGLLSGYALIAGIAITIAAGLKLYPLFLIPLLGVYAFKYSKAKSYIYGVIIGAFPLLFFTLYAPWWNFLAFHAGRGLQVESLYASLLWFIHYFIPIDITWHGVQGFFELGGDISQIFATIGKIMLVATTLSSMMISMYKIGKAHRPSYALLIRSTTLVIVTFIAFNYVLSPQYLLWLLPCAGLLALHDRKASVGIIISIALTYFVYPRPSYGEGLVLFDTTMMLIRNVLLVVISGYLFTQVYRDKS